MEIDVYSTAGDVVDKATLDETVWNIEPNIGVMHQALLMQQANARQGTHDTKTRSEVRGGGKKPWRQKGTGRARQGSTRAPQWIGGGTVWGPHPRKYTQRMPKKMRQLAVRSALSAKLRDERVTVMSGLGEIEGRTKAIKAILATLPESRSTLIVVTSDAGVVSQASGNLPGVRTLNSAFLNVRDLLKYERLIVMSEALPSIEAHLALPEERREPSQWKLARLEARSQAAAAGEGR
jgi:large subunit ribosomal protein L4